MGALNPSPNLNSLPQHFALRNLLASVLTNGEVLRLSASEILCTARMLWPEDAEEYFDQHVTQLLAEWVSKGVVELAEDKHYWVSNPQLLLAEVAPTTDLPAA